MEVIKELAFTVPVTVLAGLLGAPASSSPMFRDWADRLLAFQGMNRPAEGLLLAAQDALLEARQYLAELIVERRSEPGADLISLMACPGDNAESLSDAEIINTGITLLVAGHETTTSLIGNGPHALLSHAAQWAEVKSDKALVGPAIEEILRFESPVARQPRLLKRDVELRGRRLRAGQMVFQMLGSANRDPTQFRDPDSFAIHRDPNRHIGFGHGIHFCIGAPLSRAEGEIVFGTVIDRLPDIRLTELTPDWDVTKPNSRVLRSLSVAPGSRRATVDHHQPGSVPDVGERPFRRGVVAVIRTNATVIALTAARGLANTSVVGIEVTMTVPDAPKVIARLRSEGVQRVGAGTVRTLDQLKRCVDAGADFLVCPHLDPRLVDAAAARHPGVINPRGTRRSR
jgi:hypothetical protein